MQKGERNQRGNKNIRIFHIFNSYVRPILRREMNNNKCMRMWVDKKGCNE